MPWKAQLCPFCDKQYANKQGLINHLLNYVGERRWPTDGFHDVLKIQTLPIMNGHFPSENIQYQCPSCAKVISGRSKQSFLDHVIYRQHYGTIDEHAFREKDFDLEPFKIWRPRGVFPFFRLPFDLREMIYKATLCFEKIQFRERVQKSSLYPAKGIWLQHVPTTNLLSLLTVSRQVYNEARRVFYRCNKFVFRSSDALPIFLIGIGSENAALLRSIRWYNAYGAHENVLDIVESLTTRPKGHGTPSVDIWNDEKQFLNFVRILQAPQGGSRTSTDRLLRLDHEDMAAGDIRYRFGFSICCYESNGQKRKGVAAYELRARKYSEDDPVRIAALQSLVDASRKES